MTAVDTATRLRRVVGLYAILGVVQAVQSLRTGGHGVGGFFWDENDLSLLLSTVTPIAYFYGANATSIDRCSLTAEPRAGRSTTTSRRADGTDP